MLKKFQTVILLALTSTHLLATTLSNTEDKIKKRDTVFVDLSQSNKFSGAVLIAINGAIRFEKPCGLVNRYFNVSNTITLIILSNINNGTTLLYKKIREALEFKGALENF